MKKEFDFNDVGKRTPYSVPEGFFEDVTRRVRERIAEEGSESAAAADASGVSPVSDACGVIEGGRLPLRTFRRGKRARAANSRSHVLRRVVSVVAVAACLAVIGYVVIDRPRGCETRIAECRAVKEYTIEETFARMSDDDLTDIAAIASTEQIYDVF